MERDEITGHLSRTNHGVWGVGRVAEEGKERNKKGNKRKLVWVWVAKILGSLD